MDIEVAKRVNDAIGQLRKVSLEGVDFDHLDPVVKMMLVAHAYEVQKIRDYIDGTAQRIVKRYCTDFIPYEKVGAVPAIVLINPTFKARLKDEDKGMVTVGGGAKFSYKCGNSKLPLNYIPLFQSILIPFSDLYVLTPNRLSYSEGFRPIKMGAPNCIWVGITTKAEVNSLNGLSILIKGTNGIPPERICIGAEGREILFSTMDEMETIDMAEPFDAQQSSGQFFSFISVWKENLLNMEDATLILINDGTQDRDLFKPCAYPRPFQQKLEENELKCFKGSTLWLQLVFPDGYTVPDTCEIVVNVLPVVNVDINSVTLTQSSPIAKLQKQDESFFLSILETSSSSHRQGFSMMEEEIIVRDFDAVCYHNGDLYRDVRNLYNRFVDDYYAFKEYNAIKDDELIKQLRDTINRLGKDVGKENVKFKFDSGTYVMKNINHSTQFEQAILTKVSYLTSFGKIGNTPAIGDTMENKKLPGIEPKVVVVASGMGGSDKASADTQYELLRYYALTNDRLYTKMDIEAFLRKEVMDNFGKEEFNRIHIRTSVEGAGGTSGLRRGLYIDIEFKDKKNYDKSVRESFDKRMENRIANLSCLTMPISVNLINLEKII